MIKRFIRGVLTPFASHLFKNYFSGCTNESFNTCLSFDCDLPADIEALPALLDLLKRYELKASFACIGAWIEKNPRIHKRIIQEGHEIINHTYSHPNNEIFSPNRFFNKLSYNEQKDEIKKCDEICKNILNYSPIGFRTPHFGRLHCKSVYKILSELSYKYSSSTLITRTKSRGQPLRVGNILEIPMMTCPEHYFPLFDTWHCYRSPEPAHTKENEFFTLFKKAVRLYKNSSASCVFYFDPQDAVRYKDFEASLQWLRDNKILIKKCEELI